MSLDAVVVGAGPNGLAAAARLAVAGWRVKVYEAGPTIGGGSRTAPLAEGAVYDVCAAVHPFGAASPAFEALGLAERGLRWVHPPLALAHPLDDGSAAELGASPQHTAATLGADGDRWLQLTEPLVARWPELHDSILGPIVSVPRHPLAMARFGAVAALPATVLARVFKEPRAKALLAGLAAHATVPLSTPGTSGLGLALGLAAYTAGWPVAEGGSQRIVDALAEVVTEHGGEIECGAMVRSLDSLPKARAVLCDVTPPQLVELAGGSVPGVVGRRYRRWRYGPGACKVDYLLSGPVPWTAEACRRAGTVHLGGTFEEVAAAEAATSRGRLPEKPYVLVAQPSLADPTRAPEGMHVLWAYCHVPHASPVDASGRIEAQLDRFAPGWRDLVVARKLRTAPEYAAYNPNVVGGDISGGAMGTSQLLARPIPGPDPYKTPVDGVWLCSGATAPGPGVHGMCGWLAAASVLEHRG